MIMCFGARLVMITMLRTWKSMQMMVPRMRNEMPPKSNAAYIVHRPCNYAFQRLPTRGKKWAEILTLRLNFRGSNPNLVQKQIDISSVGLGVIGSRTWPY
jgi:hypothetical protein